MSFASKLKQRLNQMQEAASHLLADEALQNSRLDICHACPHFLALTSQCLKCGCFMNAKTKIKAAKCPIEKW